MIKFLFFRQVEGTDRLLYQVIMCGDRVSSRAACVDHGSSLGSILKFNGGW